MLFIESRGNDGARKERVTFGEAILDPSASFGGLYIPESIPNLTITKDMVSLSYKELAKLILIDKFAIDIEENIIDEALNLYSNFDDSTNPAPIKKLRDDLFVNELYHGPTRAFKDMALVPFGKILSSLAQKRGENYLILAATSGDTGPATLNSFKNRENIKVVCLYPDGGTSDVQRLQMVCEDGENLKVIGVIGDFDDTQNALKRLLNSKTFKNELESHNIKLSAANSVNFGRIIFQIIYHFWSYLELLRADEIGIDEEIYLVIPSGNFGNALGAYYAKKMGLPIKKILISSNQNNILTDLITNGEYNLNSKKLTKTISPAMDILKSSNVERILFDKFGANRVKNLMEDLEQNGAYKLNEAELNELQKDFSATFSSDDECKIVIKEFAEEGYIMDTHTATTIKSYKKRDWKNIKTVIYSTAEWTKFAPSVLEALNDEKVDGDIVALQHIVKDFNLKIAPEIEALFSKEIKHKIVVEKEEIDKEIIKFLK